MLLWLSKYLSHNWHFLRVFQYLTFRSIVSALTSLLIVLFVSPYFIERLTKLQIGQTIRELGPKSHFKKSGTPTMGGSLIIIAVAISMLLWGDYQNRFMWVVLLVTVTFGFIGWIDDYRKIVQKNTRGLPARWKFFWQSLAGLATAIYLYTSAGHVAETELFLPFVKEVAINWGWFYIIFSYFVIVGSSNAVNLTDGLDGLALMPTIMVAGALGIFAYLTGNFLFSHYLTIPYVPGTGEMAVFCSTLIGACLGFLWYNTYPAQVFMGDVGSLGLGAALGVVAVIVRHELVYLVMAGVFVIETLSVIIQVASFKLTGKRVFLMAPIHHHFELKGWPEPKIIVRFWIVTLILVLCGLATLKIR